MSILVGVRRIDAVLDQLPEGCGWLGDHERERLARITHPQRRAQYLSGHGYARELLVRFGGGTWRNWALTRDGLGRPLALRDGAYSQVHVSLSHSGGYVACAVAGEAVGVDIEYPARQRDLLRLVESLYPSNFVRALAQCDEAQHGTHFFQRWTLDEARGKAEGRGLRMHALKSQAWQWTSPDRANGWTWNMPAGWLAVAVLGAGRAQQVHVDADGQDTNAQAWQWLSLHSTRRIE